MNQEFPPRPSLLPAIVGISLTGLVILALGFWVSRRQTTDRRPSVNILSLASDTTAEGAVELTFQTTPELELLPTGWGVGRHHLHALVNGTERMPAAADIRPLGNTKYRWKLGGLPQVAEIQLVWALPNHRIILAGSSEKRLIRR